MRRKDSWLHIHCKLSNKPAPLEGACNKAVSSYLLSSCASGSWRINHDDKAFSIAINTDHIVLSPWLYTQMRVRLPWEYHLLKRQTDKEHRRAVCEIESRSGLYFHGFSGVKAQRTVNPAHFVCQGKPQSPGNAAMKDTGTSPTIHFCFWGGWPLELSE